MGYLKRCVRDGIYTAKVGDGYKERRVVEKVYIKGSVRKVYIMR